jgi:hypothetical protein
LGLPDPDPLVRVTDPGPFSHKDVERTEIMLAKIKFEHKIVEKIKFLRLKIVPASKL